MVGNFQKGKIMTTMKQLKTEVRQIKKDNNRENYIRYPKSFVLRALEYKKERGYRAKTFADLLGLDIKTVYNWLARYKKPVIEEHGDDVLDLDADVLRHKPDISKDKLEQLDLISTKFLDGAFVITIPSSNVKTFVIGYLKGLT